MLQYYHFDLDLAFIALFSINGFKGTCPDLKSSKNARISYFLQGCQ